MLGASWMAISAALILTAVASVFLGPYLIGCLIKVVYGQSGELAQWHTTVRRDPANLHTPHEYWSVSISYIEKIGGKLNRSWGSHATTGDRMNREYNLKNQTILLENDRWNGFTLSGGTDLAKPLFESITSIVENVE